MSNDQHPTTTPEGKLSAGDVIHFRRAVTAFGAVRKRGDELVLTADNIATSLDRDGRSWLDAIDAENARIGRGPWPEGVLPFEQGSTEWEAAVQQARARAWAELDPDRRNAMLADVDAKFGSVPSSWSFDHSSSDNQRAYEKQLRERAKAPLHRNISRSTDGGR